MERFLKTAALVFAVGCSVHLFAQPGGVVEAVKNLPVLDRCGVKVGYEGSIDKKGKNADWDWCLYRQNEHEWVVFDVKGSGCIYNIVQHRYLSCSDPLFRFYFDGDTVPACSLRLSEFGEKYPFVPPVSDSYIGPLDNGRGPIRVARSFVPMYYREGCKITTDVKLEGNDRAKGEGGWGHVVYHSFSDAGNIAAFLPEEDMEARQMLKRHGLSAGVASQQDCKAGGPVEIAPGQTVPLLREKGGGVVSSVNISVDEVDESLLHSLWIRIAFDGHPEADVYCPAGAFFGNSLGYNDTEYLLMGVLKAGFMYNTFPMTYWEGIEMYLENKGQDTLRVNETKVALADNQYEESRCGYFRNTPYYMRRHTPDSDSEIGKISGTGKMVAAHVTCYGERPNIITCEGDVRVYIDGNKTPKVESDGSESYVCFGWGFPTPPETHPFGGYDGLRDNPWSMTRLCVNDYYPFYKNLEFNIESGEYNNQYLEHEGTVFYYGKDEPALVETDCMDLSSEASIEAHGYVAGEGSVSEYLRACYEGSHDKDSVAGTVFYPAKGGGSEFSVKILPENNGVRIRRTSDQREGRQCAEVYVDGEKVFPQWYVADSNPCKRWLDDEFEIPASMTRGKDSLHIRICPVEAGGKVSWNESKYAFFIYKD